MDTDINNTTIYNWFDKCGVISNIRTQLRQNLVHALKCKDISLSRPRQRSAKQYVYDLLIAEYLLTTNFAYTLSVFTSEAPLPAHFDQLLSADDSNNGKMQMDYLLHTLETLGVDPQDSKGRLILHEYSTRNDSLLICLLHCLRSCVLQSKKDKVEEKVRQSSKKLEKAVGQDEETQTDDISGCDRCKQLIQIRRKLVKQKEEFDRVLNEKSEKLKKQAQTTEQQLILLQEKTEQVQNLLQTLHTKRKQFAEEKRKEEEHIHEKKLELLHKEDFLLKETNRLEVERNNYKQFEENLQRMQTELTKVKRGIVENVEPKENLEMKDVQIQTDQSFMAEWRENELLIHEKQDLISLVREQQERIQQLTRRVVQLSRQLEETQLTKVKEVPPITVRVPLTSTLISEGSSTEELLLDAKMRVQVLEQESMAAEKRYEEYILRSQFCLQELL